ncbi:MAG: hypothetical protein ACOYMR_00770 [Ilumatobacteraceae bacterium]
MNDELHDPELEAMLGLASGAFPDVNVAYESVRGRVRQAKRRRVMVVSSAACAVLLAGGVLAVQFTGTSNGGTAVADTPTVVVETSKITESTDDDTTEPSATTESSEVPVTSAVTESTEAGTSSSATPTSAGNSEVTVTSTATSSETSTPGHGSTGASSSPSTSVATTETSAPKPKPTLPPGQVQVPSKGGSVTYSFVDGVLQLIRTDPADGWTVDPSSIESRPDRIRVEFVHGSDDVRWRIEIRTEGGKAPVETSQHG